MQYHEELQSTIKQFAHGVYDISQKFPKDEIFGMTSQIRRASLSVLLNYTEGYARKRDAVMKQFYEIAYGSLKETLAILEFATERKYMTAVEYESLQVLGDKIGKMLWGTLSKLK